MKVCSSGSAHSRGEIGLDSSLLKSGRARAGFDRDGRARANTRRSSVARRRGTIAGGSRATGTSR